MWPGTVQAHGIDSVPTHTRVFPDIAARRGAARAVVRTGCIVSSHALRLADAAPQPSEPVARRLAWDAVRIADRRARHRSEAGEADRRCAWNASVQFAEKGSVCAYKLTSVGPVEGAAHRRDALDASRICRIRTRRGIKAGSAFGSAARHAQGAVGAIVVVRTGVLASGTPIKQTNRRSIRTRQARRIAGRPTSSRIEARHARQQGA
jgi:hypothetical protein